MEKRGERRDQSYKLDNKYPKKLYTPKLPGQLQYIYTSFIGRGLKWLVPPPPTLLYHRCS